MPSPEDLYQEIILDHNRYPRHFGQLQNPTHSAMGSNPLCGDEIMIQLRVVDGEISDLKFSGQGCAISRASASMMTGAISGKTTEEALATAQQLLEALLGGDSETRLEEFGELVSLDGVKKFPARIKCATLAWHALIAALEGKESVSTEQQY